MLKRPPGQKRPPILPLGQETRRLAPIRLRGQLGRPSILPSQERSETIAVPAKRKRSLDETGQSRLPGQYRKILDTRLEATPHLNTIIRRRLLPIEEASTPNLSSPLTFVRKRSPSPPPPLDIEEFPTRPIAFHGRMWAAFHCKDEVKRLTAERLERDRFDGADNELEYWKGGIQNMPDEGEGPEMELWHKENQEMNAYVWEWLGGIPKIYYGLGLSV